MNGIFQQPFGAATIPVTYYEAPGELRVKT